MTVSLEGWGDVKTDTQGRLYNHGGRDWSDVARSKDFQEPPQARRDPEGLFSRAKGSMALPTP